MNVVCLPAQAPLPTLVQGTEPRAAACPDPKWMRQGEGGVAGAAQTSEEKLRPFQRPDEQG